MEEKPQYGSCVIVGDWGTGKTTAAATAGTPAHPVVFLDMDNKLHKMGNIVPLIASKQVVQWAIDDPLSTIGLLRMATSKLDQGGKQISAQPKGYLKLVEYIEALEKSKCILPDGRKISTVVLDSYTTVTEHIKRLILSANDKMTMTMPLYGTLLSNYEEINNTLLRLPCNVIIICHEQAEKDELTGQISIRPLIEGQMKFKLGKDFEEVYAMVKKVQNGKATYMMNTIGDNMRSCRTSRGLAGEVEPDFKKIFKI